MDIHMIDARDLPDLWFQAVYDILEKGKRFTIDRGSYAGQTRLEYDYFIGHVKNPGTQPLIPDMPAGCNLPPPVEEAYIYGGEGYDRAYIEYLMSARKEEGESYTYGERLTKALLLDYVEDLFGRDKKYMDEIYYHDDHEFWEDENVVYRDLERPGNNSVPFFFLNQIELAIWTYKNKGYRNNQIVLQVAQPSDMVLRDPPCVLENTIITTREGFKKVQDVEKGDYVLTHKGRFKKVLNTYKNFYNGNVTNVDTRGFDYNLYLTEEHPVLSVKADFCPYDKSLIMRCKPSCKKQYSSYEANGRNCKKIYKDYKVIWEDALKVDYLNYIAVPTLNLDEEECPYSDFEMYIFGLFLAEGDYLKDMSGIRFNFGHHELDLHQTVSSGSLTLYGINPTFDTSGTSYRINLYKKELARKYYNLFGKGALNKKIPMNFIFYSNNKLSKLLEGYIDGDGHRRKNKEEFFTSSEELHRMFKLILQKLGKIPSCSTVNVGDSIIEGRVIKSNGTGYYTSMLNKESQNNIYWEDDNYYYLPFKGDKIKFPYNGFVYNFEVEDDNSYIAEGIPVHNCLRSIDTRIQDDKLHFFVYFRSWDLWGGLPANLAGIQNLKEYMASEIGVEDGEMLVESKGLHLYGYAEDLAKLRCLREDDDAKGS